MDKIGRMNVADSIEIINGSIIQHGHHNGRIYIMHLDTKDVQCLIDTLDKMAVEKGYEKIFAKIPADRWKAFEHAGYVKETIVPGFFNGVGDGLFIAKFFSKARQEAADPVDYGLMGYVSPIGTQANAPILRIATCSPTDARALAAIYRRTFKSYAFPIDQPEYLERMMRKNGFYLCIRDKGSIVAAAALETDSACMACEMTDFATMPEYRGRGLAGSLLDRLDDEARLRDMKTAYTIARADSKGMNRVFLTRGYRYAGRLTKNTQIDGRIRSMNVWYKHL
jgi:putative beta-lysine N-acetyltransferase